MTASSSTVWGDAEARYFYELTPERILDAVEASGVRCTGRCLTMNSLENRVYEVEIEIDSDALRTPSDRFRIVKFYRPGRWNEAQLLEEHAFLADLIDAEIPVVAPESFQGRTLHRLEDEDRWFAVFPKQGGRNPEELTDEQLRRIGRLLARVHNVGAVRSAPQRIAIGPDTYGLQNLEYLRSAKLIPLELESRYSSCVEEICRISRPWFERVAPQRIHGDAHLGNLLWDSAGPFWVDFDDMREGPCVQDLWLLLPGRDRETRRQLDVLLDGYSLMRPFDHEECALIEPLRALRFVHFTAWIANRWEDPAFKRCFPNFASQQYWLEQLADLQEQLELIQRGGVSQWGIESDY